MRITIFIFLFFLLSFGFTGCKKRAATQPALTTATPASNEAKFDVCGLLTGAEIEAVQGSPIKETKSSGNSGGGMRISQCFYSAAEFSKSVSLAVTQTDPNSSAKRSANAYWKESFGKYENEEKEKARESASDKEKKESLREQHEKEEAKPPTKISGVGDEAFWTGNRVGGALYVLRKDKNAFIRISVGGPDKEQGKIDKSKALAQKALDRL